MALLGPSCPAIAATLDNSSTAIVATIFAAQRPIHGLSSTSSTVVTDSRDQRHLGSMRVLQMHSAPSGAQW